MALVDLKEQMRGQAGLETPELDTSTKLRKKNVATVCQIFNLSENESD